MDIIVPVTATVVVICVGVLVVCVALTRRKPPPPLMNPGLIDGLWEGNMFDWD